MRNLLKVKIKTCKLFFKEKIRNSLFPLFFSVQNNHIILCDVKVGMKDTQYCVIGLCSATYSKKHRKLMVPLANNLLKKID